jgi:hypothetical protein
MSADYLVDTFARWLPRPVYRFVGGPADGKNLAVTLVETARGLVAPEALAVAEPEFSEVSVSADGAFKAECRIYAYRFVPSRRFGMNRGHYELAS